MVKKSKLNYWKYRSDTLFVFFIDKKAATSGELMKSLQFRQPEVMNDVKKRCAEKHYCLGYSFIVDHYLFIVGRESYHQDYNPATIQMILRSVFAQISAQKKYTQVVFDCEDYAALQPVVEAEAALCEKDVIITNHCEWGNWDLYDGED